MSSVRFTVDAVADETGRGPRPRVEVDGVVIPGVRHVGLVSRIEPESDLFPADALARRYTATSQTWELYIRITGKDHADSQFAAVYEFETDRPTAAAAKGDHRQPLDRTALAYELAAQGEDLVTAAALLREYAAHYPGEPIAQLAETLAGRLDDR